MICGCPALETSLAGHLDSPKGLPGSNLPALVPEELQHAIAKKRNTARQQNTVRGTCARIHIDCGIAVLVQ